MKILSPFAGEMLVLSMLIFLSGRIFFTRRTRRDALALLAPVSFLATIMEMFAWGLRFTNVVLFALSSVALLLNYRSIIRMLLRLFVDTYSLRFSIASILFLLLSIFVFVVAVLERPVILSPNRYNVNVSHEYYSCPISDGAAVKKSAEIYDSRNLSLYTFSNKDLSTQKDTLILFVPDIQAETLQYEPYLVLLARSGYTVLSADLYEEHFRKFDDLKKKKFLRRSLFIWNSYRNGDFDYKNSVQTRQAQKARARQYHELYEAAHTALMVIAKNDYPGKNIFVISDGSSFLPEAKDLDIFYTIFGSESEREFRGALNLSSISEYKTSGFGFVAQTSPMFAKMFLGYERDNTSFAPSYCAMQTLQKIEDKMKYDVITKLSCENVSLTEEIYDTE